MPLNVLWLQSGGCGGCSMSLLCADTQDFAAMLRGAGLHLLWHPALSLEDARGLPGVRCASPTQAAIAPGSPG